MRKWNEKECALGHSVLSFKYFSFANVHASMCTTTHTTLCLSVSVNLDQYYQFFFKLPKNPFSPRTFISHLQTSLPSRQTPIYSQNCVLQSLPPPLHRNADRIGVSAVTAADLPFLRSSLRPAMLVHFSHYCRERFYFHFFPSFASSLIQDGWKNNNHQNRTKQNRKKLR